MRLNKKGFAVSTILYSLLIIFLILILLIYALFDSTNGLFKNSLDDKIAQPTLLTANNINILTSSFDNIGDNIYILNDGINLNDINFNDLTLGKELEAGQKLVISNKVVINPFVPGDYPINYQLKDENDEIISQLPITIRIPVPSYTEITDSNPGTFDGTGTSGDPYLIKSIEDIVTLSNNVAGGNLYVSKYFKLVNNLDFNSNDSYVNYLDESYGDINGNSQIEGLKVELTTGKGFLPIGNNTYAFKGIFDGNFKSINNLYINRPESNYVGFFGKVLSASLRQINLYNANITGAQYTAAIVGYLDATYLINSKVIDGNVLGSTCVGLASGYANWWAVMNGIIVKGNVKGSQYVGGLIGYIYIVYQSTIKGINIGGSISGINSSNCSNCYRNIGYSRIGITNPTNRFLTFSYPDVTVNGSTISSNSSYSYNGSNINNLSEIDDINFLSMIYDTYISGDDDGDGYYFDYIDNDSNIMVLKSTINNPITFTLSGTGDTSSPWLIEDYEDYKMALTRMDYGTKYFRLMTDIDFSDKHFYMLSTYGDKYNVIFRGFGYKFSNIDINIPEASFLGLIAYNDGYIVGLNVENINITGTNWLGSIVGLNDGGIRNMNIKNSNITGSSMVGLVTGENTSSSDIMYVAADGNVVGTQYVGGIVGYTYIGIDVRSVLRDGNITGTKDVGRIYGAAFATCSTFYSYALNIEGQKIKVNGATVTSTNVQSKNGKDASESDIANLTIYSNAGFNTTLETSYIWYIDNGVVKMRKGTSQTQ